MTRRSQVQILPPLLPKAPKGAFGVLGHAAELPPLGEADRAASEQHLNSVAVALKTLRSLRCRAKVTELDRSSQPVQELRRQTRSRRPVVHREARRRHRIPRAERFGQVDDDPVDPRSRRSDRGPGLRERQALPRPSGAATRGWRAARGALGALGSVRVQPPARTRADTRYSASARERADRPGWSTRRRAQTGRSVLAR
jgi:hypothetical protein